MLSLLDGLPGYAELLAELRAGDDAATTLQPVGLVEAARPFVVAGRQSLLLRQSLPRGIRGELEGLRTGSQP